MMSLSKSCTVSPNFILVPQLASLSVSQGVTLEWVRHGFLFFIKKGPWIKMESFSIGTHVDMAFLWGLADLCPPTWHVLWMSSQFWRTDKMLAFSLDWGRIVNEKKIQSPWVLSKESQSWLSTIEINYWNRSYKIWVQSCTALTAKAYAALSPLQVAVW